MPATAIEHDGVWAGIVRRRDPGPAVEIVHIDPNLPWTGEHGDAAYKHFREYVDAAAAYAPLDFILVDGRARRACLRRAREWLAPRAWVALHDANRDVYRDALALYPHGVLLTDRRTGGGGLFLGSVDADPRDVIDADRHRALWRAYARLGRWFHHIGPPAFRCDDGASARGTPSLNRANASPITIHPARSSPHRSSMARR